MSEKPHGTAQRRSNRLASETSPYLRQHATNPVDWYPWGDEALERARREDKPLLVSIGYSACHWCHVMERESFEDEAIAEILNRDFVAIKVDREERPDLDHVYMSAVQLMTGRGGWPLNVFCTPEGAPFFGGTYFPPDDRYAPTPSFKRLIQTIASIYRSRPEQVRSDVEQLVGGIRRLSQFPVVGGGLEPGLELRTAKEILRAVDLTHGGLGSAPKFPNTFAFELLLRAWHSTGEARFLEAVTVTLDHMAAGGIYDHLAGGFARYSTDDRWLVPHFEKMLYDNALLAELYLDGFRATGRARYRTVVEEVLDFLLRDMATPEGGFCSAFDADSEGEEGKYYVWSRAEVEEVLGADGARLFGRVYDVTEEGNWEGVSILQRLLDEEQAARYFSRPAAEVAAELARQRAALLERRRRRVPPGLDDKVLTAWNGLVLSALSRAGAVLDRADYRAAARRTADFLWSALRDGDGRLLRSFKDGRARFPAYLDDHACFARGLLDLFEATDDAVALERAVTLGGVLLERFEDREDGGFFYTAHDHESLIARTKEVFDSSTPAGNAVAIEVCVRLHELTGDDRFRQAAQRALELVSDAAQRQPLAFVSTIRLLARHVAGATEVVILGSDEASEVRELAAHVRRRYRPDTTVLVHDPATAAGDTLPVSVRGRAPVEGAAATAFVCRQRACSVPVTTWSDLEPLLDDA